MGNTTADYGKWIVDNKHLKGTPEFNKVAEAYQLSKKKNAFSGSGVFNEQVLGEKDPNNPEGTLLGRELKRGLLRSASTPFTVIAGSAASRLGEEATLSGEYGENNLLMESFKEHSGLTDEAIANLRKSRGTDLSTPEGAANELTKMGYGPTNTQNFLDIYKIKLANAKALSEDPNKRQAVIESGVKNITKANELNAAAASIAQNTTAQSFSKMHEEHGDNSVKQLLSDAFENPAGFGMYMTEIMVQSSPQIIAGLATSALTKNPAAGVSVLGAGTFLQEYGPSVNEFLQNNGINKNLSKKEAVALLADRDLMRDAAKVGATRATMITLFEVLGMSAAGKGIMKNFAVNAAAGSGGEASAQLATQDLTGKPLNPREIVLEGLAEFGQAPFEAGIVGAGKVKNRIKSPYITNKDGTISLKSQKNLTPLEAKAYTSLAKVLKDLADAGGMDGVPFDLMDINPESKKGAKTVLDNAHRELVKQMNKMFGILGQKDGPLNEKQVESLEELKVLIRAQVAKDEGRNKTKGQVGRGNYDALETLVGNTQEGKDLINTLMMLDALTQLDSKGLQGKLSTFTDTFSISGRIGGKNQNIGEQVKSSIKPILSLGVASQTYGTSILGQLAIPRLGKAIDKKRGTYSVLDKYIKDNIKGDPLDAPTGPSILAAKALKDQENKLLKEQEAYDKEIAKAKKAYEERLLIEQQEADAKEAARRNLPPHPDSPQGTLENATGLNRAQVASILRILKRLPRLSKRMKDGITDYQQSVGKGGRVGPEGDPVLSDVIRHVAGMAEELGITPPRSGNPDQGGPANTQLETPAIARGIEDNKKVLAELTERAKSNSSVEPYRAPLEKALNSLGLNLGVDPESAANEIVETAKAEGVPNKAVKSYLKPYVDRIIRQKYSKKPNEFQGEQVDTTEQAVNKIREARVMPIPNKKSYLARFTVKVAIDPEVFDGEKTGTKGRYIDRDTGADLTGKTFAGANINTIDGPGNMETSDTEVEISDERIPGAYTYRANLIQNRNGKKWSWVNKNTNQITHEEGIVSIQGGKDSKHFYTFNYQIETPVTMDAVKTGQVENSVVLKPKTKGNMVLGNKLGKIKVPGGGIHTIYDQITIEPMETDSIPTAGRVAESKVAPIPRDGPALNQMPTALGNGADIDYQDAATLLAQKEGITDGQIEGALRDPSRDGEVSSRPNTRQQDGRLYPEASAAVPITADGPGNPTRQSRGPALTTPDRSELPSSPSPDVRQVKPYVQPAKKVFEIGKEGGKYEDGIGTLGEALELASALNLTVFFMNKMDTPGQSGEYRGIEDFTDAAGVRRSTTKATLKVLRSGANHPLFDGRIVDDISEFTSLMHEVAHGLTIERTDREQGAIYRTAENPLVAQDQALETAKVGSFEDFILDAVENYKDQVDVLQEIIDLQENIDVAVAKKPEWGTKGVRQMREVASIIKADPNLQAKYAAGLESSNNEFRQTYLSTVAELAVDPMWVYLVNPKLLKSVAPKTAKAIRKTFNNFGGPKQPVTFYSYPLATIMAVVMAVLANMEQEEEERLRQPPPPPGALSPQMGALSA